MVNKIISVLIDIIFPKTYLEKYLQSCSLFEFLHRITPRVQHKERLFSPFYYKDSFVKDCIIELKERNNQDVAWLFSYTLSQYMLQNIDSLSRKNRNIQYYIVPIPQHISKTKEKGFIHTHTLSKEINTRILKTRAISNISFFPCISKKYNTKRLHDLLGKQNRFKIIKNTMCAHITKQDARRAIFFIIDDVYTTGATFKEARRTLLESGALQENLYFISIAH